jgi:hypothetical protein
MWSPVPRAHNQQQNAHQYEAEAKEFRNQNTGLRTKEQDNTLHNILT